MGIQRASDVSYDLLEDCAALAGHGKPFDYLG